MYHCVVCGKPITSTDGDPHTDESSGGDCHEECCDHCHPELRDEPVGETDDERRARLRRAYTD